MFRKWWFGGAVYLKALEIFVCFYHKDFSIIFCGNFILFGKKRIRKKKSHKNLVLSFRDFFNLFSTLHVVLRNGNSNCRDGCINLSNHLSGGDEILNAWETETVSSGTTVEY